MSLQIPDGTREILDGIDSAPQALAEFDVADRLSEILKIDSLSSEESRGAVAEWAAFFFRPLHDEDSSPWNSSYYGPTLTATSDAGQPIYIPDLSQIDADTIAHWESRAALAQHPILRARYADLVWDLKPLVVQQAADIQFARSAIDAYIDALHAKLHEHPIHAVQALQRALHLSLVTKDAQRTDRCKESLIAILDGVNEPQQFANWLPIVDGLLRKKRAGLDSQETAHLTATLERNAGRIGDCGQRPIRSLDSRGHGTDPRRALLSQFPKGRRAPRRPDLWRRVRELGRQRQRNVCDGLAPTRFR